MPPAFKKFIYLALSLSCLLFVGVITLKIGWAKIAKKREEIASLQKTVKALEQKEMILGEVAGGVVKQAGLLNNALPAKNSALVTISQVKKLANEEFLVMDSLKAGAEIKKSSYSQVNISFDIEGEILVVLNFLKKLQNIAPLTNLDKVKISQSITSLAKASVTIKTYWAAYPVKLPPITEPLKDFTAEEKETIVKILSLNPPEFVELIPQENSGRQNPFE